MPTRGSYRYTEEELREAVAASSTMAEVLRRIGLVACGGNYENVRDRCAEWGIDAGHLDRRIRRSANGGMRTYGEAELRHAVENNDTLADVIRGFGGTPSSASYRRVRRDLDRWKIEVSDQLGRGWRRGHHTPSVPRRPLRHLLVNGRRTSSNGLKRRLLEEGVRDHVCEACERTAWRGRPIPLELDHVDGDRANNLLENLRLLCPNCHALTPTYRGRNIGRSRR